MHAHGYAHLCALSHMSTYPHTYTPTKKEREKRFIDTQHILGGASKAICNSPATKESMVNTVTIIMDFPLCFQ